jgi:hypothetical protein
VDVEVGHGGRNSGREAGSRRHEKPAASHQRFAEAGVHEGDQGKGVCQ